MLSIIIIAFFIIVYLMISNGVRREREISRTRWDKAELSDQSRAFLREAGYPV